MTEAKAKSEICITNTGKNVLEWTVNTQTTLGLITDKTEGKLVAGQKECLNVILDVQYHLENPLTKIFLEINPKTEYSSCFSNYIIPCDFILKDCVKEDVELYLKGYSGYNMIIGYRYYENSTCFGGVELPNDFEYVLCILII